MAYETRNYHAFPLYPVTGPQEGSAITTFEGRVIRALLVGIGFKARLQIANVINRGRGDVSAFTPSEDDWVTVHEIDETTPQPVDLAGPARWTRLVLDSGTLVSATIEEDTRAAAGTEQVLDALEEVRDQSRQLGTLRQIAVTPEYVELLDLSGTRLSPSTHTTPNGFTLQTVDIEGV